MKPYTDDKGMTHSLDEDGNHCVTFTVQLPKEGMRISQSVMEIPHKDLPEWAKRLGLGGATVHTTIEL